MADTRFVDDLVFAREPRRSPPTVYTLILRLGVDEEPETAQRSAVEAWLRDNTPSPTLLADLAEHGYTALTR